MEKFVIIFLVAVNIYLIVRIIKLILLVNTYEMLFENLQKDLKEITRRNNDGVH